ncbi:hypothetical protein HK105_207708 [Polyrhizophydium stewartii]|uniref:Transmembrane protein n=1 Tax=Polyrhizophydium stewartii TaxID=2732419 RepID=A0ABR4MZW8_9FUNG|nr:hypothetical protein HK105_003728 [Polyrhizophydium stewartii]
MLGAWAAGPPSPPPDRTAAALRYVTTYAVLLWAAATLLPLWELPPSTYARLSRVACIVLVAVAALELPLVTSTEASNSVLAHVAALVHEVDFVLFYVAMMELIKPFLPYWNCVSTRILRFHQLSLVVLLVIAVSLDCIPVMAATGWVFRGFNFLVAVVGVWHMRFLVSLSNFVLAWMPRKSRPLRGRFMGTLVVTGVFAVLGCAHMLVWLVLGKSLFEPYLIFRLYDCFQLSSLQTMQLLRKTLVNKPPPTPTTLEAGPRESEMILDDDDMRAAGLGESIHSMLCSNDTLSNRSTSSSQPFITVADPYERQAVEHRFLR